MTFRKPILFAVYCLLFNHSSPGDVLVLKNGEKMEGKILRQDDEKYVVEVKVSESIRDEKVIPRAEVLRIELESEDEKAFKKIADLVPTPDLLSAEVYGARIERLEGFLKEYPSSAKAEKIKEMIESLEEELAVVTPGGFKLGGELIPAEDYEADAYAYDARISEKKIREAITRRDLLAALRMFEAHDQDFSEAEGRPGLVVLIKQVLAAYRAEVSASLESLDSRLAERSTGLERMNADDRVRTERALREEAENLSKRFTDEKAARVKWVTPHVFHKESLEETMRQINTEFSRLDRPSPALDTPLAEVYRNSWEKLASGTDEEKKAVLEEAKAKRLPEPYLTKLNERAGLTAE